MVSVLACGTTTDAFDDVAIIDALNPFDGR
jgi:hypothetical protein